MSTRLARLQERRRLLVAQAAVERAAFALEMEPWRTRLAVADRGIALFRRARQHPALITGGIFLLAAMRPRALGTWLRRGLLFWRLGRLLRSP
jgi:hypothetical protein